MQMKRDDGTDVDIEYNVVSYGSPAAWTSYGGDPAEPPEVEILMAEVDGVEVELTEAERERLEGEIAVIIEEEGPPDDFD